MELTSFIIGVLTVVFILDLVGMFMIIKKINKNQENIQDCQSNIEHIHRIIDEHSQSINLQIDEVYRQMDSRLDKLENKLTKTK
jgi:predicted PurR-regulated permease PerM